MATEPKTLAQFIGGASCPPAGGEYLDDLDPATGEVIARVPRGTTGDVDRAVNAAKAASREWATSTAEQRARLLEGIADRIEQRTDELALLESRDTGKPVSLAKRVDIPRAVANFRFFAGAIRHSREDHHPMPGAINYTQRRPLGVVGLITPWNLPLYLLTWKTAPALAMGNAIVAKPSELTPLTAAALAEIVHEAALAQGAPTGLFNLIHGYGPDVGAPLTEHPGVSAISFTGGTATGRHVAAAAAKTFKKLSLELGGKNPTLVFADCDLPTAIEGATRAAFTNQGQVCLCGSRILVERPIYDAFLEGLVERTRALKVGDPRDPETQTGAVISQGHRAKVEGYIELAQTEGGQIAAGGKRPILAAPFDQGAFLEPTVITGLSPGCRTVQEEIFGPVVTVHPFDTEAEALEIANGVRYGLSASVWTQDLSRAHRVSTNLEVGMVWVNTWLKRDLRVPFGGSKESGLGREGGQHSLNFYSEVKNVCIQLDSEGK